MAFPANPTVGDLYTNPISNVEFIFNHGAWMLYVKQPAAAPVDIVNSTNPDMTISAGQLTGLPYIKVNGNEERITLHSELDGSDNESIDMNAGYF